MPNSSIAILISGGGTTLKNLLSWRDRGILNVKFCLVVSSNENAGGLQYARDAKIPIEIVKRKNFADATAHSEAVFKLCRKHHVKLVVMGGYLEHLIIPPDYENRVVNIHPSLIPAFCGKGYYGERVHRKALEMGVKLTGCTVHFVDNEYDHGPIIAQRSCAVLDGDTPETLQRRVFELECQLYPEVIDVVTRGRVTVEGRQVKVRGIV